MKKKKNEKKWKIAEIQISALRVAAQKLGWQFTARFIELHLKYIIQTSMFIEHTRNDYFFKFQKTIIIRWVTSYQADA